MAAFALPIERSALEGVWVQRAGYAQADLQEDLTVESDLPLSAEAPAGTEVLTVGVIGDRNAGKTTFLHAFVNQHDRDWLRVTSVLPVLSGSFRNTRYGAVGPFQPGGAPVAEAPYLDTDVAAATVLVTIEDFAFFARDFGLADAVDVDWAAASYVALRFLEVGGDHLEALVRGPPRDASPLLLAALDRSRAALARADRVAYFVDARALAGAEDWDVLRARLLWVRALNGAEVTLYVSRDAEREADEEAEGGEGGFFDDGDETDDEDKAAVLASYRRDSRGTALTRAIAEAFAGLVGEARSARVVRAGHGGPRGSRLDVPGLFSVLISLFHRRLVSASSSSSGGRYAPAARLLASHVYHLCAHRASTGVECENTGVVTVAPWVGRWDFAESVADEGPTCCGTAVDLAAQLTLAQFDAVAADLRAGKG